MVDIYEKKKIYEKCQVSSCVLGLRMGTIMRQCFSKMDKSFLERRTFFKELLQRTMDLKSRLLGESEVGEKKWALSPGDGPIWKRFLLKESEEKERGWNEEYVVKLATACGRLQFAGGLLLTDPAWIDTAFCVAVKHCGSADDLGLQSRSQSHYRGVWLTARHRHR